jgi:DNA-binding ferritin-like protein
MADAKWTVGAARNLPISDSDEWDGAAAQDSIFERAGGDDFDPEKACQGFLVYDAAEPKKRSSYKLPIAHVVGGELQVPKGAIRAAASRLPQADLPDDVKAEAQDVLDAYKKKAGIGEDAGAADTERAFAAKRKRMLVASPKLQLRGLYDCSMLAYVLDQLGYLHNSACWEKEIEGDDSAVPAMLGEALQKVGATLIAMTTEEVNELLAGCNVDPGANDDEDLVLSAERAYLAAAKTPRQRAWRRGIAAMRVRAGRVLSQGNAAKLQEAQDQLKRAVGHAQLAGDHTDTLAGHSDALTDLHSRAASAHDKMAEAIEAANGSAPADVAEKLAKVQQYHKALAKHLDGIGERAAAIGAVQADTEGEITGASRAMKGAQRCIGSVLDAATDADETDAATERDYRQRQADMLALAATP